MASVAKITVTNVFADDTTSKVTLDGIKPENLTAAQIEAIKAKITEFNDQKGGSLAPKMKSKSGANWVGIKAVTITTNDRTYIF